MKKTTQEAFDELRVAMVEMRKTIEVDLRLALYRRRSLARLAVIVFGVLVLIAIIVKSGRFQ